MKIFEVTVQKNLSADLYPSGLLQVSNTDSWLLAEATGVKDEASARQVLEILFGVAGHHIPISIELSA